MSKLIESQVFKTTSGGWEVNEGIRVWPIQAGQELEVLLNGDFVTGTARIRENYTLFFEPESGEPRDFEDGMVVRIEVG